MSRRVKQNIWIACPWKRRRVAGYYKTDSAGRYLLDQRHKWVLQRTRCFESRKCSTSICRLQHSGRGTRFPRNIIPIGN